MKTVTKRISLTLVLLAVGITGVLAYTTGAAGRLAGRPSVVVTVRLKAVMESLNQWATSQAAMTKMAQGFKAEDDKYTAELKPMETDLKAEQDQPDSQEKRDLQELFAQKMLDYQAWLRVTKTRVEIEKSLLLQNLYKNIKDEVKNMASAEGFDIVLVDDSQGELGIDPESRLPRDAQILQQVAARRMLYANPDLDITNDLITRMNNAYNAGPAGNTPANAPAKTQP